MPARVPGAKPSGARALIGPFPAAQIDFQAGNVKSSIRFRRHRPVPARSIQFERLDLVFPGIPNDVVFRLDAALVNPKLSPARRRIAFLRAAPGNVLDDDEW